MGTTDFVLLWRLIMHFCQKELAEEPFHQVKFPAPTYKICSGQNKDFQSLSFRFASLPVCYTKLWFILLANRNVADWGQFWQFWLDFCWISGDILQFGQLWRDITHPLIGNSFFFWLSPVMAKLGLRLQHWWLPSVILRLKGDFSPWRRDWKLFFRTIYEESDFGNWNCPYCCQR